MQWDMLARYVFLQLLELQEDVYRCCKLIMGVCRHYDFPLELTKL